jgi:hypothetical protein
MLYRGLRRENEMITQYRRRGAPLSNRNALKSGRYTAEAKAERKRKRLLLRQLRAGLAYARSVIRARAAAATLRQVSPPNLAGGKNFQKSKNNSRRNREPAPRLSHIRSMQVPVKGTLHRRNRMEEEGCCGVMKKFVPISAKSAILRS